MSEPPQSDPSRPWSVVTGASAGLGADFARQLAAQGRSVILAARRVDRLETLAAELQETYGVSTEVVSVDLAEREGPATLFERSTSEGRQIDLLVNNAGFGALGAHLETPGERHLQMLDLNVTALTDLTHRFASHMLEHGLPSHVVNIASLAGRMPVAGLASYVASKHAVVGLSASVRLELLGSGVTLGTICPTAVDTRLASGISHAGLMAVEPVDVAEAVVESWETRTPEIVVPKVLGPLTRLHNALPDRVQGRIRRMLNADRVLTGVDEAARDAYEQDVLAS